MTYLPRFRNVGITPPATPLRAGPGRRDERKCLMSGQLRIDPDQAVRLAEFREQHPGVMIGSLRRGGIWQARIPEPAGETVITRYTLAELLDRLGELTEGAPGELR